MAKIIIRVIFLLSLAFNVAFVMHLISMNKKKSSLTNDLALNQTQTMSLQKIHNQNVTKLNTLRQKLAHSQLELLAILKFETTDKEKLTSCLNNIQLVQSEIQKLTVEEILQSKKLLTAEQCGCLLDKIREGMKISNHRCDADCCQPSNKQKK